MGFPIGNIAKIAGRVLGAILTSVPAVEAAAQAFKTGTGADKKAAVLSVVQAELAAAEMVAGRDLANDADVITAAGAVNDAVVAFHNLLARKIAPAG